MSDRVDSLAGDLARHELRKLGKYEIIGELGRGAMGVVYQARDPIINRMVALKTLTATIADTPSLLQRFYREAQSAGGLQHPNIVTIYDMGEEGGLPYIAMELIEGRNLEQAISSAAVLPVSQKLGYGLQACRALDYAHKRGIIHRDIKPGNVMVNKEGTVKVVDFGIARVLETPRTATGMLIGTFAYMSPEQYNGEHADERSDIWSFGVLLYELLAYKKPFTGQNPASLMQAICHHEPPALRQISSDCPVDVEAVVHRMLRKSASERFQSMEDVLLALDPICRVLQSGTVNDLVAESRQLVDQHDYSQARDVLRQALHVDSSNTQARNLLEKVNAELKRLVIRPKAQRCVDQGQRLLEEGKLQEARAEVEAALYLDSAFEPALELQKRIQHRLDRAQIVAEWLQASRQRLAEGLPDDAEALLAKIIEAEPQNQEAHLLQRQISEEKAERERRLRLLEQMQVARTLWTQQSFAECINLLTKLQAEYQDEVEVARLLEAVREDQAEQLKQQAISEARTLLAAQRFDDCIHLLTSLQKEAPVDVEVAKLLEAARDAQAEQNKQQGLAEARMLLVKKRYDDCIALLSRLQKEFPTESEVGKLLNAAQEDRRQEEKQQKLEEARSLLASQRFAECIALLTRLKDQFPQDQEPHRLLDATRRAEAEVRRHERVTAARKLLAERRLEECLGLLNQLQSEFPNETEVGILLKTLHEEKSEQEKKQQLAEARSHLAAQHYAEALEILEALAKRHPKDGAVSKLRKLVLQEQEGKARFERLQQERSALKRLVNEKKYLQAIAGAEALLKEFPGDYDLARLLEFARNQQAQIEQQTRLRELISQLDGLLKAGDIDAILRIAESELKAFPGNIDLVRLRGEAELRRKEREARSLIEQRVREIRARINRQEFSDAVSLARETLATLGPDTDVHQLLSSAQVELHERERKQQETRQLESIQILLKSGRVDEATQVLSKGIETEVINSFDPRVQTIQQEIEAAKTGAAAPPSPASSQQTIQERAREYALFERSPALTPPVPLDQAAAAPAAPPKATPQPATPPSVQSIPNAAAPSPEPYQPPAVPEAAGVLEDAHGFARGHQGDFAAALKTDAVESRSAQLAAPRESEAVRPWRRGVAVVGTLAGIVILAWAVSHFGPRSTRQAPQVTTQTDTRQRTAIEDADKLVAANRFEEALQVLQKAAALNGPLKSDIDKKTVEVQEAVKNEQLRVLLQQEERLWQRASDDVSRGRFSEARSDIEQVLGLAARGGRHRADATQLRDVIIPRRQKEEQLLALAEQARQKADKNSLLRARELYGQVVALGGPRLTEAQQAQQEVNSKIQALENEQSRQSQIAILEDGARLDLQRGAFRSSRQKAEQIRRDLGSDPTSLTAEIDRAERNRFDQLASLYNNLKARDDEAAQQQISELQPAFQALVDSKGPHASEARAYIDGIPAAILEMKNRRAAKSEEAAFQRAVQAHDLAKKTNDKGALERARSDFHAIASGGGLRAQDAQEYIARIGDEIAALNVPPAPAPVSPAVERDAVLAVLNQYAAAYSRGDLSGIVRIWSDLPDKQRREFENTFKFTSSRRMEFQPGEPQVTGTTATVIGRFSLVVIFKQDNRRDSRSGTFKIQLRKMEGSWVFEVMQLQSGT